MTNITLNRNNRTIVISKAFEKKASKYGTPEYNALVEVQRDNAGFKVVVKAPAKSSSKTSRITLSDIKRYVSFHDDENKSKMAELERMCNAKANGELNSTSFFAIKKWFFEQYPEVA